MLRKEKTITNFGSFMRWVNATPAVAQSARIRKQCGDVCKPDYVLHTETLKDDWLRMLQAEHLPLYELPHVNQGQSSPEGIGSAFPAFDQTVAFTPDVLDIIHRVDAAMFSDWGYARRTSGYLHSLYNPCSSLC